MDFTRWASYLSWTLLQLGKRKAEKGIVGYKVEQIFIRVMSRGDDVFRDREKYNSE